MSIVAPRPGGLGSPSGLSTLGSTAPKRLVVGIGELAVARGAGDEIVTFALGSCIAVCLWDSARGVAGLLHYLLPEARINPDRAKAQPEAFADTGIPILLGKFVAAGGHPKQSLVKIIGGAEVAGPNSLNVGRRNILAAKNVLWKHGLLIKTQLVGGNAARTVYLSAGTGRVKVTSGNEVAEL